MYVAWKIELTQKFARLVLFCLIKKRSFILLCVLHLFSERWQSTLFQIFLIFFKGRSLILELSIVQYIFHHRQINDKVKEGGNIVCIKFWFRVSNFILFVRWGSYSLWKGEGGKWSAIFKAWKVCEEKNNSTEIFESLLGLTYAVSWQASDFLTDFLVWN